MRPNVKIKKPMARVTFWQVFNQVDSNTLAVIRRIKVGGAEFEPGFKITRGVAIAGIDFFRYLGNELEVDENAGIWILRRIYTS